MKRSSKYYPLSTIVEVKPKDGFGWWETMAAFNAEPVAVRYAKDCARANRAIYQYRVMRRNSRGRWEEVE